MSFERWADGAAHKEGAVILNEVKNPDSSHRSRDSSFQAE
jgi:hypothetical protein